jgi:hypothetical protein
MTTADLVDGAFGKAIEFDGIDDNIEVPDHASLDFTTQITIEVLYYSTADANQGLVSKDDYDSSWSDNAYTANINTSTTPKTSSLLLNGTPTYTSTPAPTKNQWQYAAFVYDKINILNYIDGVAGTPVAYSSNINANSHSLKIAGYFQNNTYQFIGKIAEIRLSDAARSAAWIKATNATLADSLISVSTTPNIVELFPAAGEYKSTQTITLAYDDGNSPSTATIYYTTDGSDPDNTDTEYTTPITVGDFTLKAIAYDDTASPPVALSSIASAVYTVSAYDITVSFDPVAGEYGSSQTITISSDDASSPPATIYYTTDGSDPDPTDTEYTTPITIGDFTLKAVAYDETVSPAEQVSEIASAAYTVSDIPIYIGSTKIVKVYVGATQISGIEWVAS